LNKNKGIILVLLSAICFGAAPAFVKLSYSNGTDNIGVLFIRSLLSLPILFIIILMRKTSLAITPNEFFKLLISGALQSATSILLFSTYSYIAIGLSTTLHFCYPIVTTLVCIIFFKEKPGKAKLFALLLAMAGIFLSTNPDSSQKSTMGFVLAIISGFCYAALVIHLDKSGLKNMDTFKMSFYINSITAVISLVYGKSKDLLHININGRALIYILISALLVSAAARPLFQTGLRFTDAPTVTMLSSFEPISSIAAGSLLLAERLTLPQIFGCFLTVCSVILISMSGKITSYASLKE